MKDGNSNPSLKRTPLLSSHINVLLILTIFNLKYQRCLNLCYRDKTMNECCIEYTSPWAGFKLTDCIGSCKSNYHTITTMMALTWTRKYRALVRVMVFNATFNNISVISWQSVLLVGNRSTKMYINWASNCFCHIFLYSWISKAFD
jgi:hypothetical protein